MAGSSDAEDLKIDPTCATDRLFVVLTRLSKVRCRTIGYMNVLRLYIDMIQQTIMDLAVKALRMFFRDSHIFIEVESRNTSEVQALLTVESDQFLIKRLWRLSRCKSQHRPGIVANLMSHYLRGLKTRLFMSRIDDDEHR